MFAPIGYVVSLYNELMEKRDRRVDGWFLMDSPWATLLMSGTYLFLVKYWGPRFMKNREPMDIKRVLLIYNAVQVLLSAYVFVRMLEAGWLRDYSFRCQPVDYTNSPKAELMLHAGWLFFMNKFLDFFDTFAFIARKKFSHVSRLHVVHHATVPVSMWPATRFFPGGHTTFFAVCNSFVHVMMYSYYLLAALGPKYQKFLWWKQHLTNIQMVQFVLVMIHAFQLLFYDDCDFPWQFAIYIGAHAIFYFVLFLEFYISAYLKPKDMKKVSRTVGVNNGEEESIKRNSGHVRHDVHAKSD